MLVSLLVGLIPRGLEMGPWGRFGTAVMTGYLLGRNHDATATRAAVRELLIVSATALARDALRASA